MRCKSSLPPLKPSSVMFLGLSVYIWHKSKRTDFDGTFWSVVRQSHLSFVACLYAGVLMRRLIVVKGRSERHRAADVTWTARQNNVQLPLTHRRRHISSSTTSAHLLTSLGVAMVTGRRMRARGVVTGTRSAGVIGNRWQSSTTVRPTNNSRLSDVTRRVVSFSRAV